MIRKSVKLSLLSVAIFFCLLGGPVLAAPEQLKIATVSVQDILTGSTAGKAGQKVIEAKLKSYEEKFKGTESDLETMAQEIDKKKSVWDQEVLAEKQRDFQKKKRDYELARQDAQTDLQQLEKQIMEPIIKDLHDIIAEIGKKEGYTLILENSQKGLMRSRTGLLYAADALDISAAVLKELDARSKK